MSKIEVDQIDPQSGTDLTVGSSGDTIKTGGNLDTNDNNIVTASNRDLNLYPNGTGAVEIGGNTNPGTIILNCEQNSHGIKLQSPPHSANQSYTLKFPSGNVTAGKFLKVDSVSGSGTTGVGTMTFADAGSLTTGSESIVKAWCKWTGTTIGDSYNVSSVTNSSTGQYILNFADSMDNANFATVGNIYGENFANAGFELQAQTTSSTTLLAKNMGTNSTNNMGSGGYACAIIIGDNTSL